MYLTSRHKIADKLHEYYVWETILRNKNSWKTGGSSWLLWMSIFPGCDMMSLCLRKSFQEPCLQIAPDTIFYGVICLSTAFWKMSRHVNGGAKRLRLFHTKHESERLSYLPRTHLTLFSHLQSSDEETRFSLAGSHWMFQPVTKCSKSLLLFLWWQT